MNLFVSISKSLSVHRFDTIMTQNIEYHDFEGFEQIFKLCILLVFLAENFIFAFNDVDLFTYVDNDGKKFSGTIEFQKTFPKLFYYDRQIL